MKEQSKEHENSLKDRTKPTKSDHGPTVSTGSAQDASQTKPERFKSVNYAQQR